MVQENSGETLHDYQVLVELDRNNIRFTDVDRVNPSYMTCEFDASSKRAKIWVAVSPIPVNGEVKPLVEYIIQ